MCYTCPIPYVSERIHAAALYCSDGRVGEHFDDFLTKGLGMPRVDRLCLPGGPASLAGHVEAHVEQQGAVDALGFLIEAHGLDRVVLIQHEGCAFYTARLGLDGAGLESTQRADLAKSAAFVRKVTGVEYVDAYFARKVGSGVSFEPVGI